MDFEKFYCTLIGQMEPEKGYPVENCFTGECERLYDKICKARRRIAAIMTGRLDRESREVMEIMNAYEAMQRLLCEKSFDYGARYGRGEIEL